MAKLSNKEVLTRGQKYFDKKKAKNQIQEVTFDPNDRLEYLTGFHKRKVDRQKKAQQFKQEQSHKERLEERQRIRNERKQMVAEKLQLIKEEQEKMLRLANGDLNSSSSDDDDDDNDKDGKKKKNKKAKKAKFASDKSSGDDADANNSEDEKEKKEAEEEDEWKGFDDDDNERTTKGILKKKVVFNNIGEKDGEPVNDETTVTIESLSSSDLNNSNGNGGIDLYQLAKLNNVELKKSEEVLEKAVERAKKYAVLSGHEKPPKQKKRKFRYLTKAERRVNTHKERSKRFKRDDKDKK